MYVSDLKKQRFSKIELSSYKFWKTYLSDVSIHIGIIDKSLCIF